MAVPAPPAPPAPPPAPPAAVQSAQASKPKPKSGAKPKPKPKEPEYIDPNSYAVGVAVPNFTATRPVLREHEAAYNWRSPYDGEGAEAFVASSPRRPQPRTTVHPDFELPEGFEIVTSAGFDNAGIPLRLRCIKDGAEMVFVPAATFVLGKDGHADQYGPAHPAYVDAFYMDKHEVSLKQYEQFRAELQSTRKPPQAVNPFDPPEYPALGVSWRDAQSYGKWAGRELPTEAEWERAARGTEGFDYPWGDGRPVWDVLRRPGQIDPVGSHPNDRSIYGVMDLAGSAREWCADWYADDTYLQSTTPDGSPPRNPLGPERPSSPNARVIKGAGVQGWHLWTRSFAAMKEMLPDVGFRCVLRIKLPEAPPATGPVAP